jgi:hypothetical protein|uniref:Uncharacterized protein n=1 Tax=Zea mays TaxID=4577 RepID=C4IY97_MAIZE|nr:unknown [Zea mays]
MVEKFAHCTTCVVPWSNGVQFFGTSRLIWAVRPVGLWTVDKARRGFLEMGSDRQLGLGIGSQANPNGSCRSFP